MLVDINENVIVILFKMLIMLILLFYFWNIYTMLKCSFYDFKLI